MQELIHNVYFLFFISCILVLTYDVFSSSQKIMIIHGISFAVSALTDLNFSYIIVVYILSLFIIDEYLTLDQMHLEIVSKLLQKISDFIYRFIFQQSGGWMLVALFLQSQYAKDFWSLHFSPINNPIFQSSYSLLFISISIFIIGIQRMSAGSFVLFDCTEIVNAINKVPYKSPDYTSLKTIQVFLILTSIEDRSFYYRENTYTWISLKFLWHKIKSIHEKTVYIPSTHRSLKYAFLELQCYLKEKGPFRTVKYVFSRLSDDVNGERFFLSEIRRLIKFRIRGYSTIEMQLIRNIAIRSGYLANKNTVRRKIFELLYSDILFRGFKNYLKRNHVPNLEHYKDWLLYVYIYSVNTKISTEYGTRFYARLTSVFMHDDDNATRLFICFNKYPLELFFVLFLGLNHRSITPSRLTAYRYVIATFELDTQKILLLARALSLYPDACAIPAADYAINYMKNHVTTTYFIQNQQLPMIIEGTYYGPDSWPSYGPSNCWTFAQEVYWRIWNQFFTNERCDIDNIIPENAKLALRRITPRNVKIWFSKAVPGAVVRITDDISGDDTAGKKKHSQIIADISEDTVSIYENTNERTQLKTLSFTEYAEEYKEYVYFKYIKFPHQL